MNEVKLEIEGLESFARRSMDIARSLDRGEGEQAASRISFESMEGLLKVLTPNRWRLLRMLRERGAASIRALSQSVGRDYRGVHADVAVLLDAGLIERDGHGAILVVWSRITVDMGLDAAA